jgi:hypothetical protein
LQGHALLGIEAVIDTLAGGGVDGGALVRLTGVDPAFI